MEMGLKREWLKNNPLTGLDLSEESELLPDHGFRLKVMKFRLAAG